MTDSSNLLFEVPHTKKFISKRHASKSLEKMESYLMTEQLTDVVLISGKRRIPAHRLVLSAACDYFAAMFRNNLKEASQKEIDMGTTDGASLQALIKYCYTGEIEFETDTAQALLETACLLQLNEVVAACCEFIEKELDPSNCIGIKYFADSLGCIQLLEASQNYTIEHFGEVIQNQEFLKLSEYEVSELLASDALSVPSEEDVFQGLMSWIKYDLPIRKEKMSRLLTLIRIPLLSPSFFVDEVATNTLIRDLPEFGDLLVENYKYRVLPERPFRQSQRTRPRNYTEGILVLGGYDQTGGYVPSVKKYNARLQEWTEEDKISFCAPRSGITEFQGKLYVCGGLRNGSIVNEVWCFNMKTKTRLTLPPMPTLRSRLGVAMLKDFLYAVGGMKQSGSLETVERFDPVRKQWSYVNSMSRKRSDFGLAALDGKLYAVGGFGENTRYGNTLASVECYDPSIDQWNSLPSMQTARREPGVGVLNGLLYVVGGVNSNGSYTNSVERYDPKTNTWSQVAPMKCGRKGACVCAVDGNLFALGGFDGRNSLDTVEAYNLRDNVWVEVGPLKKG